MTPDLHNIIHSPRTETKTLRSMLAHPSATEATKAEIRAELRDRGES